MKHTNTTLLIICERKLSLFLSYADLSKKKTPTKHIGVCGYNVNNNESLYLTLTYF